jgi:putative DNA primase/helicase
LSRFHILSNELPQFGDASTAIVGRFVLLLTTRSWLGREDLGLEPDLRKPEELSGILNWALDGLHRLTVINDNCFTRVEASDDAIIQMRDLASPVAAFVRTRCVIDAQAKVKVDDLYAAFKTWAGDGGHKLKTKETFGRDLRAAAPSVCKERLREDDDRVHVYVGIDLKRSETFSSNN